MSLLKKLFTSRKWNFIGGISFLFIGILGGLLWEGFYWLIGGSLILWTWDIWGGWLGFGPKER